MITFSLLLCRAVNTSKNDYPKKKEIVENEFTGAY